MTPRAANSSGNGNGNGNGDGPGLGTFGGVFTPSILTILGVIMYLRFGWVVGNVGLVGALLIVTLATSITLLTGLSIAMIATDRQVRVGGAYYMISRSLGIEPGGAIGIPLYLAQALSVALYTVGFAESVNRVFPILSQQLVAIVVTVLVALLAIKSAAAAIRAQYVIMAAIGVSLVSLVLGRPIESTEVELFGAAPRHSESFWVVFAVFFPAVTGIMAGVNMSGDLKDPARSIPRGTLAAIGVGYAIYMALPIILASRADALTLIEDPLVMRRIALWGDAILIGVWGATLSSAVGSILAAPRVLQALARDRVLPGSLRFLGAGHGPADEPRTGTAVTLVVALAAVMLGDLNVIAPILTMFFLTTYLVLNVVAGVERFLDSPSFRPEFGVHWILPVLGAIGCLVVMFLINPGATIAAAVIIVGIFTWLERREMEAAWGDVRRGIWMAMIRMGVFRISRAEDTKNWRPHVLVLSGAPRRRWSLIELGVALTHNRGLVTVASVLPTGSRDAAQQSKIETLIHDHLERNGMEVMVRLTTAPDIFQGAEQLVETYGLGPVAPNTVILGASLEEASRDRYCRMLQAFHTGRRNVLVVRSDLERGFGNRKRIDVWWGGLQRNGGLMMILAYLLRISAQWTGAEIHVKLVVPNEKAADSARRNLEATAGALRIGAQTHVLVAHGRPFKEILIESSADADLVFLGIAAPSTQEDFPSYYARAQEIAADLPTVVFTLAAQDLPFASVLE